jgi:methylmalonyl-CoA/ethylmalonyl-CoA epimerase
MEISHLHQVAQRAVDLDRAVSFYRDVVGLTHLVTFNPPGLAFFSLGTTRLLLDTGAPTALHYLGVDDVAATTERLRAAGVNIETEPHVIFVDDTGLFGPAGHAETMAFFRDSEDNLVGLVSHNPA